MIGEPEARGIKFPWGFILYLLLVWLFGAPLLLAGVLVLWAINHVK